jgi:hypothetical protein
VFLSTPVSVDLAGHDGHLQVVVLRTWTSRDGITSFAASEDLERVVKVIDIALEYANDNYEADVLPGDSAARQRREHKATEAAQRQADLDERAAKLAKPDDP